MDRVSWEEWVKALLEAAQELEDAGFSMKINPLKDETAFYNLLALSGAEWRKDDQVNEEGPGMGKALGDEASYSPLQIHMDTWGEEIPEDTDVTVINSPFAPEFQNIDRDDLIELITTDPKLAAKAGIIVANSNTGYENWSTWEMVQDPNTPQYLDYVQQFTNVVEPPVSTTTTTIPTTTTTLPPNNEERILETTPEEKREYESQVGPNVEEQDSFEAAIAKTDIARGNSPDKVIIKKTDPNYRKGQFLKYFDRVTSFKKPDPSTFKQPAIAEQDEIKFPFGTPVTTQEVLDLLEP